MWGHSAAFSGLCRRREDLPVDVFTIAGIQWCPFRHAERSFTIITPLRAQINRILVILLIKCAGKFRRVCDEKQLHMTLCQRGHYPPDNTGSFPAVGGGKRFIKQHQIIRLQLANDIPHASELFIKLSADHMAVFFTFIMSKNLPADIGTETFSRHKHSRLHHYLSQANAAQER